MIDLLNFIFKSFWTWFGSMLLLYVICHFTVGCINLIFRHMNIHKHGYPPIHCNADGDMRLVDEEDEEKIKE